MSGTFSCPALYGMWYGEGRGGWCGWGSTELGSTWYRMGEEATSWMLCFNGARMMVLLTRCWWGGHRTAFVFIIASFFTVFKAATQEQGFNKRSAWHFLYLVLNAKFFSFFFPFSIFLSRRNKKVRCLLDRPIPRPALRTLGWEMTFYSTA